MRLLIVEDDQQFASVLATQLARHGMIGDVVPSLRQAEQALASHEYRVMLLDRQLPDGEGADFVPRAREIRPGLPIVILTAKSEISERIDGLDSGADDYLTKPFSTDELLARLRAILRRPTQVVVQTIRIGNVRYSSDDREVWVDGEKLTLPRRQLLVLEALLMRHGRTVSRGALLESVYGLDEHLESNALEAHVSKLRRALAESGAGIKIHVLRGLGYMVQEIRQESAGPGRQ